MMKKVITTHFCFKLLFPLLLLLFSCDPKLKCLVLHNPILEYSVTPNKDTIRIGDTLVLELASNGFLTDFKSKEIHNFLNDTLKTRISFVKHNTTSEPIGQGNDAYEDFKIIPVEGELAYNKIKPQYTQDSMKMKFFIIPQKTGFFAMNLWHSIFQTKANALQILNLKGTPTEKCMHRLEGIFPNINNQNFSIDRAFKKGYILHHSVDDSTEMWEMKNASYYFDVVQ